MTRTPARNVIAKRPRRGRKAKLTDIVRNVSMCNADFHACLDEFLGGRRYLERGDRELLRANLRDFDNALAALQSAAKVSGLASDR